MRCYFFERGRAHVSTQKSQNISSLGALLSTIDYVSDLCEFHEGFLEDGELHYYYLVLGVSAKPKQQRVRFVISVSSPKSYLQGVEYFFSPFVT